MCSCLLFYIVRSHVISRADNHDITPERQVNMRRRCQQSSFQRATNPGHANEPMRLDRPHTVSVVLRHGTQEAKKEKLLAVHSRP